MRLQASTGLVSCCNLIFKNASCLLTFSFPISFLSLSSIHILRIESLFLALRASDRVHFERPPARLCGRSRACACFVSNSSTLRFDLIAMGSFSSWRRDSILRPSERMSYILPQDHGVLADFECLCIFSLDFEQCLENCSTAALVSKLNSNYRLNSLCSTQDLKNCWYTDCVDLRRRLRYQGLIRFVDSNS